MDTSTHSTTLCDLLHLKEVMSKRILALKDIISPIGEPVTIHRVEIPSAPIDILNWLQKQTTDKIIYWANRNKEWEMGGVGVADQITGTAPIDYENLFDYFAERFNPYNPQIRFYGGICFDEQNISAEWDVFGHCQFFVPRFEFVDHNNRQIFACNISYKDVNEKKLSQIVDELNSLNFDLSQAHSNLNKPLSQQDFLTKKEWGKIFNKTKEALESGHLKKVVLARKSCFKFRQAVNAFLIKQKLKEITPECYHFCFQPKSGHAFLGASPERLYRREGQHIQSEAVAGTRAKENTEKLLSSKKEFYEHKLVVDHIHACLKNLCSSIKFDKEPSVLKLHWGEHLKTDFKGTLKPHVTDTQLILSLHPTPAVAGCPKEEAKNFIHESETFQRGWYAGLVGYVSRDVTEFTVAIRSGLINNDTITLFAGAGIVPDSQEEKEWTEIENKMNSFLKIFNS